MVASGPSSNYDEADFNHGLLGRQIDFGSEPTIYTVVGVVRNTRPKLSSDPHAPQVFTLLTQGYESEVRIAVTQTGTSQTFVRRLRETILSVDPVLTMSPTRSLREYSRDGMSFTRIMAVGASSLGLLALLLSAIGVFGVVAYSVTQRTREIGIRMAFGCTRLGVLALVVHGGLGLALPGLVVGGTVAVGFGHVIRAGLVGVSPLDPAALGSVGLLMLVVVVVASLLPAIRASLVEPVEALRCD